MKALRTAKNIKACIEVGNAVLASARRVKNKAIAAHLQKFEKTHARLLSVQDRMAQAEAALLIQSLDVADNDLVQLLMTLANALVADGLPGANPFKPLGFSAPSVLARLSYERAPQRFQQLAEAVLNRSGVSKPTIAAAKALAAAAKALEKNLARMYRIMDAYDAAIHARDTVGPRWEAQLAALELAARTAETKGERGLYASLFGGDTPRTRKRRKAAPPKTRPAK